METAEFILAVLNCDSHRKAEKELVNQFRDKGHDPLFAVGTSKAFHERKFTCLVTTTPSTSAHSPLWK